MSVCRFFLSVIFATYLLASIARALVMSKVECYERVKNYLTFALKLIQSFDFKIYLDKRWERMRSCSNIEWKS